jgi:fatty acid desaturase
MIGFLLLEISNAFVLFFTPDSKQVHGMGMFPAWEKSKSDPDIHKLMRYLTIWVAGSKLILVALLIVLLVWGNQQLIIIAGFAMVISMLPFYFGLFPAMKKIDENNQVDPKGFSMRLGFTITVLILALLIGSILAIFGVG